MCILNGFPDALQSTTSFPFGIWFANATTLYVADEGNGTTGKTVDNFYDPPGLKQLLGSRSGFWFQASGNWHTRSPLA
jgi:hypothetical protein